MNSDKKGDSLEPEDIPSTDTGSKLETTKSPEAGPEATNPAAPIAIEALQAVEAIEQSVEADGSPSSSEAHERRTDEASSSFGVKSVSVKKPQSFFGEQPLPMIEMAPRVLRYRSRRDVLLFSAGAVAAVAGALDFFCRKLRSIAWVCDEISTFTGRTGC